ncbi:MAG: hypothetical protein U0V49_05935 [Saprospiraceae bacterium]
MKNLIKFSCVLLCFLTMQSLGAQKSFDYEWKQYKLVFTLAADFKEETNTEDEFTASGDGMEFGIFPFKDKEIDHSDITAYTIKVAKSIKMEQLDDVDVAELNGLKGAYVEGYKDGLRIIILGFIDEESDTNFFATISFKDDDKEAEDEAVRMITSFRKKGH